MLLNVLTVERSTLHYTVIQCSQTADATYEITKINYVPLPHFSIAQNALVIFVRFLIRSNIM